MLGRPLASTWVKEEAARIITETVPRAVRRLTAEKPYQFSTSELSESGPPSVHHTGLTLLMKSTGASHSYHTLDEPSEPKEACWGSWSPRALRLVELVLGHRFIQRATKRFTMLTKSNSQATSREEREWMLLAGTLGAGSAKRGIEAVSSRPPPCSSI